MVMKLGNHRAITYKLGHVTSTWNGRKHLTPKEFFDGLMEL